MTLLYIWIMVAAIVLFALKHEIEALRKTLNVKTPWSMSAVVIMVGFSLVFPVGILYLWILLRQHDSFKRYMKQQQEAAIHRGL